MTQLEQIQQGTEKQGLGFLLIGGLAVIEHGFARVTNDIDLVVRRSDAQSWKALLVGLQYAAINEKDTFQQFEQAGTSAWPLDLMLVNDATFDGLAVASLPVQVMGARVRMVSLQHLLALKLHVLKQAKLHRFLDDMIDVIELVRANGLDLNSAELRALFHKYGSAELYDKVQSLAQAG